MGKPKLPWKRGPAAWKVKTRAGEILQELAESQKGFFTLRRAARLLGVSTQPLRDWIRRNQLKRDGPGQKISKEELTRFIKWLQDRAQNFDWESYWERVQRKGKGPPRRFDKLRSARFVWPAGRMALSPQELAHLVSCHPSLILKATGGPRSYKKLVGRRTSPCRWEITKRSWMQAFPCTLI